MSNDRFYQQVARQMAARDYGSAKALLDGHLAQHTDDEVAHSLYGTMLLQSGQTEAALARFETNAASFPNSYAAQADLAFSAHKVGNLEIARRGIENALKLNPGFYQGWVLLSQIAYQLGDFDGARRADEQSEQYDPLDADYQRIQAAMRAGNKPEAEHIARTMLQRQAGHPRAAFILAHMASGVGAHEDRAAILQHGLDHHPANQMLRRGKVEAHEALGHYTLALEEAKKLIQVAPSYFNYWTLSRVHGHLFEYDEALASIEKARSYLEPDSKEQGKLDLLKGHALKILGRREESAAAYRDCIKNTPGNGAGWWGLADFKNYEFTGADRQAMQKLVDDESLDEEQRCQAAFALAKAHEVDGDAKSAFSWYCQANGLRTDIDFDPERHSKRFGRIKESFTPHTLATQANFEANVTPIFILGMPRAGSTLLEQILSSHSAVEGTMELVTLPFVERSVRIDMGRKHKVDFPESAACMTVDDCNRYGQQYLTDSAIYRSGMPYFIDKLPPNFERVGLIHQILPNAILIDARRHPLDCCYSAFKQHFAAGHDYSYSLENLGAYYNAYLDLMAYWDAVLPGKVIRVQYENMVRDTDAEVRRVLAAMGLSFEESCIRFFENKRAVRTASSEQVRQPINTKGLKAWAAIEDQLEPLKAALGAETLRKFDRYL